MDEAMSWGDIMREVWEDRVDGPEMDWSTVVWSMDEDPEIRWGDWLENE